MLGEHIANPGAAAHLDSLAAALVDVIRAADAMGQVRTLLIASTDLTHLNNYAEVVRIDRQLVDLVGRFAVPELEAALVEERVQACGATGLVTVLKAARQLGATHIETLAYTASGDVTGDKRPGAYTVGYLAAVAYR